MTVTAQHHGWATLGFEYSGFVIQREGGIPPAVGQESTTGSDYVSGRRGASGRAAARAARAVGE
jgi:hypothetical protein